MRYRTRDRRIFELWMACWTQAEIAEAVGCPRETVRDLLSGFGEIGKLSESAKAAASHATDFKPPLYNTWKQQERTPGVEHFGYHPRRNEVFIRGIESTLSMWAEWWYVEERIREEEKLEKEESWPMS